MRSGIYKKNIPLHHKQDAQATAVYLIRSGWKGHFGPVPFRIIYPEIPCCSPSTNDVDIIQCVRNIISKLCFKTVSFGLYYSSQVHCKNPN